MAEHTEIRRFIIIEPESWYCQICFFLMTTFARIEKVWHQDYPVEPNKMI